MNSEELEKISKLLALRDGETRDNKARDNEAGVPPGEEQLDVAAAQLLRRLQDVKQGLHQLDDVPVDRAVWAHQPAAAPSAAARPGAPARVQGWRFPMTSAAAAFLISVLGVLLVYDEQSGSQSPQPSYGQVLTVSGQARQPRLIALMNRSIDLEQAAYGVKGWRVRAGAGSPTADGTEGLNFSPVSEYIIYQLAQVDGEIAALHDAPTMDSNRQLALWQERVNLLQAFVADMARHNPDAYQDTRSM